MNYLFKINLGLFSVLFSISESLANENKTLIKELPCNEISDSNIDSAYRTNCSKTLKCLLELEEAQISEFNQYYYLSAASYKLNNYKNALLYSSRLSKLNNSINNRIDIHILNAKIYRAIDNLHKANIESLNALTLSKTHNLKEKKFEAYLQLAKTAYSLKDSLKSVEYLNEAKLFTSDDDLLLGQYYYQKARITYWHDRHSEFEGIIQLLLLSLEHLNQTKHYHKIAATLDFLGTTHIDIKKHNKAKKYFKEALDIKERLNDKYGLGISYNNFGDLHFQMIQDEKAISYYKKAIQINKEIESYENLFLSYTSISALFEDIDSLKKSIYYQKLSISAKDNLKKKQKEALVYDLLTQYQSKEKDQEIKNQKRERKYLLIFLGFLVLVSTIISFLYHQKNKLNNVIIQQKKELENLNIFKNQLFSIMGHDMRGMMSKLNLSQKKLSRESHTSKNEKLKAPISKMGGMIENLNGFIENILYWGFSQTDRLSISRDKIQVKRIIDQVSLNFKYDLENKELVIINSIPNDFFINGDNNSIKVVFRNILSNAIKFSNPKGQIIIQTEENEINKKIIFSDQGLGIPVDKVPILFENKNEKIRQGTEGEKGTGLGLWLCKEMIERNNGKISVESKLGEGTSITLHFPKKKTTDE